MVRTAVGRNKVFAMPGRGSHTRGRRIAAGLAVAVGGTLFLMHAAGAETVNANPDFVPLLPGQTAVIDATHFVGITFTPDAATVTLSSSPQHGTLTRTATGFSYSQASGPLQVDSFAYSICSTDGVHCANVTVYIEPLVIPYPVTPTTTRHTTMALGVALGPPATSNAKVMVAAAPTESSTADGSTLAFTGGAIEDLTLVGVVALFEGIVLSHAARRRSLAS